MNTTIPDPWHIPLPSEAITIRPGAGDGGLALIEDLDADRMQDALYFLSGYAPDILDAILTATEACIGDLFPALDEDPEPYCAQCGVRADVFTAHGSEWMHYTGDLVTADIRPYEADRYPVVRWRPATGANPAAF